MRRRRATTGLCAAIASCLAGVAVAEPCRDPAPIDATVLEKADPALTTWTSATTFGPHQAVVKLPTAEERAARNPGFTLALDATGALESVSSTDLPCRVREARLKDGFTHYPRSQDIDPWFDELAWALEVRNWDALGHERAPTKAQRSSARATFERSRSGAGVEVRFVLTFWNDPRPSSSREAAVSLGHAGAGEDLPARSRARSLRSVPASWALSVRETFVRAGRVVRT